jgi:branched-subunit amino acid transport protein
VSLPPTVLRALRYAPAAALAAIVGPDVLLSGGTVTPLNPKLAAAVVVALVTLRWRNPWLPFIAGMAVLWGLQAVGL